MIKILGFKKKTKKANFEQYQKSSFYLLDSLPFSNVIVFFLSFLFLKKLFLVSSKHRLLIKYFFYIKVALQVQFCQHCCKTVLLIVWNLPPLLKKKKKIKKTFCRTSCGKNWETGYHTWALTTLGYKFNWTKYIKTIHNVRLLS